ncbi:MAG TPA: 3-oxoacyl-[acyl-carrier-protein] synthase III C-terminal domain-containing protein [Trebonia sp.]|jgi:alkylresorcinol/alkylpyrone synthase|nr:3-oxoacyl-[acyl-carrier-protein] synthase III C-terminal domain-containing protein [Trebonia sp.]
MTQIVAVRSAFPAHRYPQADLTRAVAALAGMDAADGAAPPGRGGKQRALLERLHGNAGVDTRHTVFPLPDYGALGSDANDRYIEEAAALGERALGAALAESGLAPDDLDLLIVTSVTGVAVPSLDALLMPRLGLRADLKRLPVFGLGCVAGAAGLARLHDYLLGWPRHTAALLAVELCSLSLPRSSVTTADLVASALFGDGAVALVATGTRARGRTRALARPERRRPPQPTGVPALPRVIATRSEVYPDSGGALGWRLGPGGFRIVLTAELAEVVERRLGESVTGFLAEHGLTVDDIGTWICHPGGPKVLDAAQRALKLPATALASSRQSLAQAGNMSSASVLHILELTVAENAPATGSFGMMIGLGPGVSAELVLLRW